LQQGPLTLLNLLVVSLKQISTPPIVGGHIQCPFCCHQHAPFVIVANLAPQTPNIMKFQ